MSIKQAIPRRKVQELKAHGKNDPDNNHGGPGSPWFLRPPVAIHAERDPHDVLDSTDDDVCNHVVRVIPRPETEIADMHDVKGKACANPEPT